MRRIVKCNIRKIFGKFLKGFVPGCFIIPLMSGALSASAQDVTVKIHVRGVYESNISLLAINENGLFKPVIGEASIKDGATALLEVDRKYLPGEFVLRFDYKEKETSTSYPCEQRLIIGRQDLELWANPMFCNNPDSNWYSPGELENNAFKAFAEESYRQKGQLGLLEQFLMGYQDYGSKFYRQAVREYESRRSEHNNWLTHQIKKDNALFVSNLYTLQYIPETEWEGTQEVRIISMINHYFDGADLSEEALTKTSQLISWIDTYVNLYGQLATTVELRDSLFTEAATKAIELAREGHPVVYGWMVDYFYRGFESNNIPAGMKALEPYLNDPSCPTSRRKEIERRLKGMEKLVAGSTAPEIQLNAPDGRIFSLLADDSSSPYILLLFWSADCSHCMEVIDQLYPWQQQPEINRLMSVVAISLDETETEITAWQKSCDRYRGWTHLRAEEGVRSKVAADYFILSTPQMILLDTDTRKIIDLPGTFPELKNLVHL